MRGNDAGYEPAAVNLGELVTTVHAVDGDALLTPQTLQKIVRVVLAALRKQEEHRRWVMAEQQIGEGMCDRDVDDWG
jgi:hypothetical protein